MAGGISIPDPRETAGSDLFEPGSSVHTFSVPADNMEMTETLLVVRGTNVNCDQDGKYAGMLALDARVKERKRDSAKFIVPQHRNYTTSA